MTADTIGKYKVINGVWYFEKYKWDNTNSKYIQNDTLGF